MSDEDRQLLTLIAAGNEQALDRLYSLYRPRLRRYLWQQLDGDQGLVEEVLQDIFLAVWQSASHFRGEAKVATWVFQIAHNIALHARQRRTRHPISAPLVVAEQAEELARNWQRDPYADEVIARMTMSDALAKLSPKHREVLELFFRQGFAPEEIAAILGIPAGTVRSRMSYARQALREELQQFQDVHARIGNVGKEEQHHG